MAEAHSQEKIKDLEDEVIDEVADHLYGNNIVVDYSTSIIEAEDRHGDEELDSLHVDVVVDNKITGRPDNCYSMEAENNHLVVKTAVEIPEEEA